MAETKERQIAKFKAEIRRSQRQARQAIEPVWMRQKHPADGLGEVFTMDEFQQSIRN